MDFGIHIGTRGCLTTRDNIMTVAMNAEDAGYAIIGVADHLIVPIHTDVRYPYTADGIWPGAPTAECFDAIATLTFLAGLTQRIKLLTSVLVVPHRPAVLTAKLISTADGTIRGTGDCRHRIRMDERGIYGPAGAAVRGSGRGNG